MPHSKYIKQAEEAFTRLGFTPREGQIDAVCKIVYNFLDNKIKNQILSAPTGTGKSLIGAAVSETLSAEVGNVEKSKSSISLVSTNVLSEQYSTSFHNLGLGGKYMMIKGASNFPCGAMSTDEEKQTAEACAIQTIVHKSEFSDIVNTHCRKCEYDIMRKRKNSVRHLTTNYAYYFLDRLHSNQPLEDRDLIVWDEAHLVNDILVDYNTIEFSEKLLKATQKEYGDLLNLTDFNIISKLNNMVKVCTIKDGITENTLEKILNDLTEIYSYGSEEATTLQHQAIDSGNNAAYSKFKKIAQKYGTKIKTIEKFFMFEYPHIIDHKHEEGTVAIKPIFAAPFTSELDCAPHNLYMSATVSPEYMQTTLGLKPEETAFIQLAPSFPPKNKEVIFYKPMSLNYTSLQNKDTIEELKANVSNIVTAHIESGERGIVLTPSFKLQNELVKSLEKIKGYKLFVHKQGEKLEHILKEFKNYNKGSAVLISPSIYEGIDLSGDLSRFQIMVKAPFPSLGDKRLKYIMDNYSSIFEILTIQKMVQGCGRSVRSKDDYAVTYILDQNAKRLFCGQRNIWKEEFTITSM
jgi:Rad3-related DNA helicase